MLMFLIIIKRIIERIDAKVNTDNCVALRLACQQSQIDKRKDGVDLSDSKLNIISQKLDIIMEHQAQVIDRIDRHINSGNK